MRKRVGYALAVLALCFLLAGCPFLLGAKAILGEWTLVFDWNADGSTGTVTITFNEDDTFVSSSGGSGTWTLKGKQLSWRYSAYPNTVYIGDLNSARNHAEGTMSNSNDESGIWHADKKPTALAKGSEAVHGETRPEN